MISIKLIALTVLACVLIACDGSLKDAEDIAMFDSTDMQMPSRDMLKEHTTKDMQDIYEMILDTLEVRLEAQECDSVSFPPLTGEPWQENVTGEWFMATGDSLHIRMVEDRADASITYYCSIDSIATTGTAYLQLHREPAEWKIYRVRFGGEE